MRTLETRSGQLQLPAFLPDATRGAVKAVDAMDLQACGIQAVMVNILHLGLQPGVSVVAGAGGIHRFMGWPTTVFCDSGGFQTLWLERGPSKRPSISANGFVYRSGRHRKKQTPEKCIQRQLQLGADVLFCLDHCTRLDDDPSSQQESVDNTVGWASKCKATYEQQIEAGGVLKDSVKLFAVIQGGANRGLREQCAERLLSIGFDGFGFGGWPLDSDGRLSEMVYLVRELIPLEFPLHGLGIGRPDNLVRGAMAGYQLFDCVMPTRDARHQRLYVLREGIEGVSAGDSFYTCISLKDEGYTRSDRPVDEGCDCLCCTRYTRAFLRHLFQAGDHSAHRLATIHNLRFYARIMALLRKMTDDDGR